jgi:hypothetical protein
MKASKETPVYTTEAVIEFKDIKIIVDRNINDSSEISLGWVPEYYQATHVARKIHRLSVARLFGR